MTTEHPLSEFSEKVQKSAKEFKNKYRNQVDNWQDDYDEWRQKDLLTSEDERIIEELLVETLVPHIELFINAGKSAVDAAMTVFPKFLINRTVKSIFINVLKKDVGLAERLLNTMNGPVETMPFVPDSIKRLHASLIDQLIDILENYSGVEQ